MQNEEKESNLDDTTTKAARIDSKKGLLSDTEVRTNIPSRLDNLPWRKWHWVVVTYEFQFINIKYK